MGGGTRKARFAHDIGEPDALLLPDRENAQDPQAAADALRPADACLAFRQGPQRITVFSVCATGFIETISPSLA